MYDKLALATKEYGNRQSEPHVLQLSIFPYLTKWQVVGKRFIQQSDSIVALHRHTTRNKTLYELCRTHCMWTIYINTSSSSSLIYPPPIKNLHPQGLTSQMPVGQMPVGGAIVYGPEH